MYLVLQRKNEILCANVGTRRINTAGTALNLIVKGYGMGLPDGLWKMRVVGQYVRPDGTPHRGYVTLTPNPAAISATPSGHTLTLILQTVRLDLDAKGLVEAELLNPNDPTISPGPTTGSTWGYCVRETLQRAPVLGWTLVPPPDLGNGGLLDLAKVERRNEDVYRPVDWFPHHVIDTPVQASRISPRNGPLLRQLDNGTL